MLDQRQLLHQRSVLGIESGLLLLLRRGLRLGQRRHRGLPVSRVGLASEPRQHDCGHESGTRPGQSEGCAHGLASPPALSPLVPALLPVLLLVHALHLVVLSPLAQLLAHLLPLLGRHLAPAVHVLEQALAVGRLSGHHLAERSPQLRTLLGGQVTEPQPGVGRGTFAQLVPRRDVVPPQATAAPAAGRGGSPRGAVYALISRDKRWEQVGGTYQSAASPAMDKDGNVFFADPASNRIYKSDAGRIVTVFKEKTGGAHALRFGADGRLYATQLSARRLVSYGPAGDEKVVAQDIQANDLVLTRSGALYFVDTAQKTVGYIDVTGKRRAVYNGGEIMSPTALTLTPDQAMLLVGDGMDRYQWSFQIAADGSLVNGEPFQRLEMPEEGLFSGVRGLTVDSIGYMWATSAMGIQVCEQPGRCTNILNKPEFTASPVTSIAFGGPDRAWLYVTQGGKVFRRETRRTGVVAWEPVKPPQPGL